MNCCRRTERGEGEVNLHLIRGNGDQKRPRKQMPPGKSAKGNRNLDQKENKGVSYWPRRPGKKRSHAHQTFDSGRQYIRMVNGPDSGDVPRRPTFPTYVLPSRISVNPP